jgi:selenocysteine-specific elongation factor
MREIILGTAGHVDHGKTSLIRALTGIDTDRLKEEKERGITIELGFAHLDLPCGRRLGIVDVPGHEKFVRNMVAGAAGMDIVAFIIAADEGIMPQTKEHFDICRLLGLKDGLIILTKKDMVEPDWLDMVQEEVRDFFADSFLAQAPLLVVSSVTGEGLAEVTQVLDAKVRALPLQEAFGPFRLAVDRVFSMKGFGTVITGTSLSGRISLGEDLMFYPSGITAKIRGIQVHGQEQPFVEAGHRTAINLQGLEKEDIQRGDLAGSPGALQSSSLVDAVLHYLADRDKELRHRTLIRLHVGTKEILGRVLLMDSESLAPGQDASVQLLLQEPVAVWPGDRFIIRSYSPVTSLGGGTILNTAPPKRKRATERDRQRNREIFALYRTQGCTTEQMLLLLEESGVQGLTTERLAARLGIFGKKLKKLLEQPLAHQKIFLVESESQRLLAASVVELLDTALLNLLHSYHQQQPLRQGLALEELRSRLQPAVDPRLFHYLSTRLIKQGKLVQEGAEVRLKDHAVVLHVDEQALQKKLEQLYQKAGLQPPNFKEVLASSAEFPEKQMQQVLHLLLRQGLLVKVNENLIFHSEALTSLTEQLTAFMAKHGEIDAPAFKDLTGLSRKFSIPLLEYFDKIKLTIRVGDKRILRKG